MNKFSLYAAGALLASSAIPAHAANFIGTQIKAGWRLPTENDPFLLAMSPSNTFIVGNGVEGDAQLNSVRFLIDFGMSDVILTFLTNVTFSANVFNGLYFNVLAGENFDTVTNLSGITTDRIHNLGSALSINFSGKSYVAGDQVVIGFLPAVPEPASWAMMIAGLGAVGAALRRRGPLARVAFS